MRSRGMGAWAAPWCGRATEILSHHDLAQTLVQSCTKDQLSSGLPCAPVMVQQLQALRYSQPVHKSRRVSILTTLSSLIACSGMVISSIIPPSGYASTCTFQISSDYPYTLHLKFYSQTRNVVWPGRHEVYVIDDYRLHTYRLSCQYGEKICYGAWSSGDKSTYWGIGQNNQSCSSCCAICGSGDIRPVNLTN